MTEEEFNEAASTQGPTIDGNITWVDSITYLTNTYFNGRYLNAYINREDSNYVMILPTDECWNAEYEKMNSYYNYVPTYIQSVTTVSVSGSTITESTERLTTTFTDEELDSIKHFRTCDAIARNLCFNHNYQFGHDYKDMATEGACDSIQSTSGLIFFKHEGFGSALRDSFFQVVSFATTAGYTRTPYLTWPTICQLILLMIMFIGGCSASTAGSIKVVRILVMLKMIARGCVRRVHPRSVVAVKLGNSAISAPVVSSITVFLFTFAGLFLFSGLVLSLQGLDMETSFTSTICMLSNTGASFGYGASMGNFSFFHPGLKIYLSALMIIGRLELFTFFMLFSPHFWNPDKA